MNDFKKIEDVPEPIREFYTEQSRREQAFNEDGSPKEQEVEYSYIDQNGVKKTGTRMDPVYHDVVHVIPLPVPEFKSWGDVWAVAQLHRGHRDDLIRRFVTMVCNKTQWRFLDEYTSWFCKFSDLESKEPKRAEDDDGRYIPDDPNTYINEAWVDGFTPENKEEQLARLKAEKPVKPPKIDIDQWFINNALELRKLAYPNDAERTEMYCNDMIYGTTTLVDRIRAVNQQYPQQSDLPAPTPSK